MPQVEQNFVLKNFAQLLAQQLLAKNLSLLGLTFALVIISACNRTVRIVDRRSSDEAATNIRLERARFSIASLQKFIVNPGEEIVVVGQNLSVLDKTKPILEPLSTEVGSSALSTKTYEANLTITNSTEAKLKLPDDLPWGPYSVKFESEATTRQLIIFSNQGNPDFAIYAAGVDAVCTGTSFVDSAGAVKVGVKPCMATLANCGADGATGCIATTTYAASAVAGLANKVLSGVTVAGVGGNITLPPPDKVSTAAGPYGVNGASVTPSLTACGSDGATGCVASADYPAAQVTGLSARVLSGQTVAGVVGSLALPNSARVLTGTSYGAGGNALSGQLTLPMDGKVLSGIAYGIFGATSSGSLTLPNEANVLLNSAPFGDPNAQITPSLNTSYPTPIIRPATPTITSTSFSVAQSQITLTWSSVTGASGYLVVMSTGNSITFAPTDQVTYDVNSPATPDQIVYVGAATSATVSATISPTTTYRFAVYAFEANKAYSGTPGTKSMYGCSALTAGGFIPVSGDSDFSTTDFCVMKYAASEVNNVATSQAGSTPWVNITQTAAKNACQNLGSGYHLLTNDEWMTLAAGAANKAENWTGGTSVGDGALIKGHSDMSPPEVCPADADDSKAWVNGSGCTRQTKGSLGIDQRRTFTLSNGEVIWDLSGNAWQWIDLTPVTDKPTPADNSWHNYGEISETTELPKLKLVPNHTKKSWWLDTWSTSEGVGWYLGGSVGTGGALRRGGNAIADASRSGLFTANLSATTDYSSAFTTFRCAWHP